MNHLHPVSYSSHFIILDTLDGPAWVSRACSILSPSKFSPVTLKSTRWPGAVIVAYNDKFANIYVGDGLRDVSSETGLFVPPELPEVSKEFVLMVKEGEEEELKEKELIEQVDPTVEEEQAFEDAKKAKEAEGKENGEDEEGEGSEAAEEED
jgi:radial spoke head protein 4/6